MTRRIIAYVFVALVLCGNIVWSVLLYVDSLSEAEEASPVSENCVILDSPGQERYNSYNLGLCGAGYYRYYALQTTVLTEDGLRACGISPLETFEIFGSEYECKYVETEVSEIHSRAWHIYNVDNSSANVYVDYNGKAVLGVVGLNMVRLSSGTGEVVQEEVKAACAEIVDISEYTLVSTEQDHGKFSFEWSKSLGDEKLGESFWASVSHDEDGAYWFSGYMKCDPFAASARFSSAPSYDLTQLRIPSDEELYAIAQERLEAIDIVNEASKMYVKRLYPGVVSDGCLTTYANRPCYMFDVYVHDGGTNWTLAVFLD